MNDTNSMNILYRSDRFFKTHITPEPLVYLQGLINLALNDARPEVILKAYIDYLKAKGMCKQKKPRLTRSGHRALQKDFKRRLQL